MNNKSFFITLLCIVVISLGLCLKDCVYFGPNSSDSQRIADEAEMKANYIRFIIEIEKYEEKNGVYPTSIDLVIRDRIKNVFSGKPIKHISLFSNEVRKGDYTYIPIKYNYKNHGYHLFIYHQDIRNLTANNWNDLINSHEKDCNLSYFNSSKNSTLPKEIIYESLQQFIDEEVASSHQASELSKGLHLFMESHY